MSTTIILSQTRVIKTRTKAPLVVVAVWPSTDGDRKVMKASLIGYAYSTSAANARQRRENRNSGPQTTHLVLPVRNGQVTVEMPS